MFTICKKNPAYPRESFQFNVSCSSVRPRRGRRCYLSEILNEVPPPTEDFDLPPNEPEKPDEPELEPDKLTKDEGTKIENLITESSDSDESRPALLNVTRRSTSPNLPELELANQVRTEY